MKEGLIRKFVEKLEYSYTYKTVNEKQNIIDDLCLYLLLYLVSKILYL
jgi:hypothetical protein